ncbi:PKD domain-containing protein [Labedella phragmitis]|uniref:PKD domain-containing protein n=1 Tax=Labedella phragmitis TaxID=2498849 RepID=UPI00140D9078|nr:PKD domain-containing protein [Labedella phragmitis]
MPQLGTGLSKGRGDIEGTGVVWDQLVVGDTVYVGGDFSRARPAGAKPGQSVVDRANFLAYDLRTGELRDTAISFNAQIRSLAVSPDQKTLYAAGNFTKVDGLSRFRLVAIDIATEKVVAGFAPYINARVSDVAVSGSAVYVAGIFAAANDEVRRSFAAFEPVAGKTLPWAPQPAIGGRTTKLEGKSLVLSPSGDKIVVAGRFESMNGSSTPGRGMAALDAVTAKSLPWKVNSIIQNGSDETTIMDLTSDGSSVYGAAYKTGPLRGAKWTEGTFKASWKDGTLEWLADCHGDSYSIVPFRGVAYTASHAHSCRNIGAFGEGVKSVGSDGYYRALAFSGAATHKLLPWPTDTRADFGGQPSPTLLDWYPSLTPGAFTGMTQAAWDVTAADDYVLYGGEFPAVNGVPHSGLARFAVAAVAPNDDGPQLDGEAMKPTATPLDYGAVRVQWTANYDRDNARLTYEIERSGRGTTTIVGRLTRESRFWSRPVLTFVDTELVAGATYSYRIRTVDPYGNSSWGAEVAAVAVGQPLLATTAYDKRILQDNPTAYWPLGEKGGGKAIDLAGGNDMTLSNAARGAIGVQSGHGSTRFNGATSSRATTRAPAGVARVFSSELWFTTTSTKGGRLFGFAGGVEPTSGPVDRQITMDDAGRITYAVGHASTGVKYVTSKAGFNDGKWHHVVTRLGANGIELFVDGARPVVSSAVTSGTARILNGYWNVGGHVHAWGHSGSSDFIAGRISNVALYSRVISTDVIVAHYKQGVSPVNAPPTAALSATVHGVDLSVSGSSSFDADGRIANYAWDFGDGATGSGVSATHRYESSGSYTVALTVTDDRGALHRSVAVVEIIAPPAGLRGADAFDRNASSGWGSADVGGAWITSGGTSGFSVSQGHGRITNEPGRTRTVMLPDAAAAIADTTVSFTISEAPTANGQFVMVTGRKVGPDAYDARIVVRPNGTLVLEIRRSTTVLKSIALTDLSYAPGQAVHVRLRVEGSGTTTLSAVAWTTGDQPDQWDVVATDTTEALQAPGSVGLGFYISASSAGPSTVQFDDYVVSEKP